MTSRELIAAEANNTDRIALYREGLFWKAYERSAYALCTQVRRFKPTRKILKTLAGGDIVSVGFPAIAADRILAGLQRLDFPSAASAGSATRMLLVAPHPIVERDFLAWKSALPISLTIPRPSAAESSCEDPTSGEPSSHDLPLREGSSRERSLHEAEPLRESSSRGVSAGLAVPVGAAASAGSATLAAPVAPAAPASAASAATAVQPHWWTRLGGRLVRWAARAGFPRAVAANAAAGGFVELGSPASVGFAAGSADDSSLSCISDVSSPAVSVGAAAPVAPVWEVAASTAANPAASTASSVSAEQCLDALRKFEVADKTPMECMLFIAELKKRFLS